MPARIFTLREGDKAECTAVARRIGACSPGGCEWLDVHPWADLIKPDIPDPFLEEWVLWMIQNMWHRLDATLRAHYLTRLKQDPFYAMVAWQQCPELTVDEASALFDVAKDIYPEFVKRAWAGELLPGAKADKREPTLVDPDV